MASTDAIQAYFDQKACCRAERTRPARLERSSRALLELVDPVDLHGRTVLEVGSGYGALTAECVRRGASRATGVDLSPLAVAEARRQAVQQDLADRVQFMAADGATARLEAHDVVVLDHVICCFFDPHALVANSLGAATRTYTISLPVSTGPWGVVNRAVTRVENAWQTVRRRGMRSYTHPTEPIDAAIRNAGFDLARSRRAGIWDLRVYRRRQAAQDSRSLPREIPGFALRPRLLSRHARRTGSSAT